MPKFQNMRVWQQAESLMQPAFIRLIANLTKQLEESTWKGEYEDALSWPDGTVEEDKIRVKLLQTQLETASPEDVEAIEKELAHLPTPYPGYKLHLTQGENRFSIDLWDLCYQICFRDYDAETGTSRNRGFGQPQSETVEVDSTLFDEAGEVEWHRLDEKTQNIVEQVFKDLPS